MDVIRQEYNGLHRERVLPHDLLKCLFQKHPVDAMAQYFSSPVSDYREEEGRPSCSGSAILHDILGFDGVGFRFAQPNLRLLRYTPTLAGRKEKVKQI